MKTTKKEKQRYLIISHGFVPSYKKEPDGYTIDFILATSVGWAVRKAVNRGHRHFAITSSLGNSVGFYRSPTFKPSVMGPICPIK